MRTRILIIVAALALVAGCAAPADKSGTAAPAPAGSTVSTPAAGEPSLPRPPRSPKPEATATEVTVRGQVVEGVEAGCKVLQSPDQNYLLIVQNGGDAGALRAGATVEVTGKIQPKIVTTCMQGTPLLVTSVKPG
jgi:hypothetical protein